MALTVGELVSKLKLDISAFEQGMAKAEKAADKGAKSIEQRLTKLSQSMVKVGKGMTKFITLPILGMAAASIKSAAEFEKQAVALETLLGGAKEAAGMLQDLEDFAATTPFQLPQLIDGATILLAFGSAAEDVVEQLRRLGDVAMGDSEKLGRLVLAFGKVESKTKATMRELNMFIEAGVPIMTVLAEQFGVTTEELFKMVEQGKVHFDAINDAIVSMTDEGGQFFQMTEKQSKTAIGLWSTMKDVMGLLAKDFGEILLPAIKSFLTSLTNVLTTMRAWDDGTKRTIITILGIVAVIGPAILIIGKLIAIVIAVKNALIVARIAVIAFSASISISPIGLVLAAVGLLVVGIALLTKKTDTQAKAQKQGNREAKDYEAILINTAEALEKMSSAARKGSLDSLLSDMNKLRREFREIAKQEGTHVIELRDLAEEYVKLKKVYDQVLESLGRTPSAIPKELQRFLPEIITDAQKFEELLRDKMAAGFLEVEKRAKAFGAEVNIVAEKKKVLQGLIDEIIESEMSDELLAFQDELIGKYIWANTEIEKRKELIEEQKEIEEKFAEDRAEEQEASIERIIEKREAEQEALQARLDEMFEEQEISSGLRDELNEALMEDHELELERINEKRDAFQKYNLDKDKINEWYTKEKAKLDKIAADKEIAERDRAYKDALTVGGALVSLAKDVTGWIGSLWEKETAREIEAGNLSDREKKKKLRDEAQRQKALAVFNAIITGALAVLTALTAGPILGPIMAVIAGIAAAIQIGIIVAEPLPAWNKGGLNITKRLQDGGLFEGAPGIDTNLARLTSGEFVVNKDATAANIDTLEDINTGGGGGGGVTINPMPLLIEVDGRAQAEYTIEFLAEESDRGNVRVNPKAIRERA